MSDRIITPIIAIGLAVLVWLYTRSRDQEVLDNYPVPVELQLASSQTDQYDLEVTDPDQVPVSFAGTPSRIRELRNLLQRGQLRIHRVVSVPEDQRAEARYTEAVRLDASEVRGLPAGVQAIIAENQNRIGITCRRIIEKRLTVRLNHTGDDRLEQIVIEPNTVLVRGYKEVLDREESLPTQLYAVPSKQGTTEPFVMQTPDQVPVIQELKGRALRVTPSAVSVRYTLKPKQKVYELAEVPVHFLCPANFTFKPQFTSDREGKVALKIIGPAAQERPHVSAYVDLTTRKFGAGLHAEEPIKVQLPTGYQLAQEPPRLASFQLTPVEAPSKPAGTVLVP